MAVGTVDFKAIIVTEVEVASAEVLF